MEERKAERARTLEQNKGGHAPQPLGPAGLGMGGDGHTHSCQTGPCRLHSPPCSRRRCRPPRSESSGRSLRTPSAGPAARAARAPPTHPCRRWRKARRRRQRPWHTATRWQGSRGRVSVCGWDNSRMVRERLCDARARPHTAPYLLTAAITFCFEMVPPHLSTSILTVDSFSGAPGYSELSSDLN